MKGDSDLRQSIKERIAKNLVCPTCGAQVTTAKNRLIKFAFFKGNCPNCNAQYRMNYGFIRGSLYAALILTIALNRMLAQKNLFQSISFLLPFIIFFILYIVVSLVIGGIGLFFVPLSTPEEE